MKTLQILVENIHGTKTIHSKVAEFKTEEQYLEMLNEMEELLHGLSQGDYVNYSMATQDGNKVFLSEEIIKQSYFTILKK